MKKRINILLVLMFAFIAFNTSIYAEKNDVAITKVPYGQEYEKWLKLPEDVKEKNIAPQMYDVDESVINSLNNKNTFNRRSIIKNSSLQSKYNTLDEMKVKVKNQQTRKTCWAFAFTSLAEIACKKYDNENYEFSPMHIDYGCTRRFKDRINPYAQLREYNDGGNLHNLFSYLSSGQGPILEEYMPFDTNKGEINYSEMPNRLPNKFIELQRLPGISTRNKEEICKGDREYSDEELVLRENIKRKIVQSGGVSCSIMMDKYIEEEKPVLYSSALGGFQSHSVVLIGYDDNFSADNFGDDKNLKPRHDGAYIAYNSYGDEWGDNGVFYISYDDVNVESDLGYIKRTSDIDYDNIFQHNFGEGEIFYEFNLLDNTQKQVFTANIFKRDNTKREQLTKVYIPSTSWFSVQNVDIEVYVNPQNSGLNSADLYKVECDVTNLNQGESYINLNEPIELMGENYAVVIKYILKDENTPLRICIENSYPELEPIKENQSFYSLNGENWNDLYNLSLGNARGWGEGEVPSFHYAIKLKAITKSIDKNIEIVDIKTKNSDMVYSDIENEISAYVTTTANLNDTSLNVKLLKDGVDVTDKIEVISLPKVKSRASNVKFKNKEILENGIYKLQVSTPENIISEKEYEVTSIENDENFVKLEYEDEKFISALKKSIDGLDDYIMESNNKIMYIKKEMAEKITNLSISSNYVEDRITSIKGIETFKNLNYLSLFGINVSDLDEISYLPNLQYLNIAISNIEKEEFNFENTKLERLSMYKCELSNISKLYVPDTIISIDLEGNHIKAIPKGLYEKARYISVSNQTIFDEVTLEQNDNGYALMELPEILKLNSPTELIFKNCEYDEKLGKIIISTKNFEEGLAEIELPFPDGAYDINVVNPYGSKYTIKYKVVQKETELVGKNDKRDDGTNDSNYIDNEKLESKNNPQTGDVSIYICLTLLVGIIINIITLKSREKLTK